MLDRKTNACNIQGVYWEYFWTSESCDILIKVDREGDVAIFHQPVGVDNEEEKIRTYLQSISPNFFRVAWSKNGQFPSPANGCGNGVCEDIGDVCICQINVVEDAVFTSLRQIPTSVEEIMQILFIGSPTLEIYDDGEYAAPIIHGEIKIYRRVGSESIDENTIIGLRFHGQIKYYKNIRSTVYVGTNKDYSFRNTPHFINFIDNYAISGDYENDAALDHYFHHPNMAPFLAVRILQRFGFSNPSPRFVKEVATAFITGTYTQEGVEFGNGEYGNLGAMLAAVILDREARTVVVDADPAHGSIREPLLKLILFLRAMEYENFPDSPEIDIEDVDNNIDQMAHQLPSVFSFFLPEYAPPGPIKAARLLSPESQIHVTPFVIGLLNGIISLTKWGFTKCYGGFGPWTEGSCRLPEGNFSKSSGNLTFIPSQMGLEDGLEVIDEMATLLTAGRLSDDARGIIADAFNAAETDASALRIAQQLFAFTPEFNSNSLVQVDYSAGSNPTPVTQPDINQSGYKAVIWLNLDGGMDSFNLLVPTGGCGAKDMYKEYSEVRGSVGMPKQRLLPIDASTSSQVCTEFGIHEDLPVLKQLYDEGDLIFFSNVGVLVEPVNKINYKEKTFTKLFSHNTQRRYMQQLDPFHEVSGTGLLARMTDALTRKGHSPGLISVSGESYALVGEAGVGPTIKFVSGSGILPFNLRPSISDMETTIRKLNRETTIMSGLFSKTWSELLKDSIVSNNLINGAMENAENTAFFNENDNLPQKLSLVTRMIKSHKVLGSSHDAIYVRFNGFDSHADVFKTLYDQFTQVDDGISSFVSEMKIQGEWDNVVIVGVSEFGRTLTPNSGDGTDHGWSGNYFMLGGGVRGGRILGEYPDDLTEESPLNVGRGRFIPTLAWDQIFNGIVEWFGLTGKNELDKVLPNRNKFPGLLRKRDLFG